MEDHGPAGFAQGFVGPASGARFIGSGPAASVATRCGQSVYLRIWPGTPVLTLVVLRDTRPRRPWRVRVLAAIDATADGEPDATCPTALRVGVKFGDRLDVAREGPRRWMATRSGASASSTSKASTSSPTVRGRSLTASPWQQTQATRNFCSPQVIEEIPNHDAA
jgi:hypothetical protein